jgi:hypothetical protein
VSPEITEPPSSLSGSKYFDRELDDDELQEILDLALGEEHTKELSKKVEDAMQEDWDVEVQCIVSKYHLKPE